MTWDIPGAGVTRAQIDWGVSMGFAQGRFAPSLLCNSYVFIKLTLYTPSPLPLPSHIRLLMYDEHEGFV